ncbi:hypothetical protein PROVRETT_07435 [Providencia rettgeri DSM 1131]|nr:hypothetical protein PROVRETT_07435 [Providencia rettgeri DSM 1131]
MNTPLIVIVLIIDVVVDVTITKAIIVPLFYLLAVLLIHF